jgi:hypothetical protein
MGCGLLGPGAIDISAITAIRRGGRFTSQPVVPDDLGLDRQVVRLDDVDRDLSRVFELDRALVHIGPGGAGLARPGRPLRSHRFRQGTGGQDEDPLAAGRAAQGLISPGPLASQPVAQWTDHAVILNLGDGGCPQPFEQAASPAKQIQEPPLPANPRGRHTATRISQGCSVVSSFRQEMTVVQIIGNGMPQVNGTGGRPRPVVECSWRELALSFRKPHRACNSVRFHTTRKPSSARWRTTSSGLR